MSRFASIYVGCKQLGIDEDDRRDLFERVTKKRSLKLMTFNEVKQVEKELGRLGFKKVSIPSQKSLEGAYAKKLQALWIGAWNLGIVKNKSDKALLAFVKRQTGVDHTRFLRHKEDGDKAIETLKAWMAREASVDWTVGRYIPDWQRLAGAKIAMAQYYKLHNDRSNAAYHDFLSYISMHSDKHDLDLFTEHDWIPVMNALGRQIRDAK